jgi:hypothetical protein
LNLLIFHIHLLLRWRRRRRSFHNRLTEVEKVLITMSKKTNAHTVPKVFGCLGDPEMDFCRMKMFQDIVFII